MKAHGPTHQHDKKSIFQFLPGPIKIKDGLFIGDEIAARDIEFIISNKVTHIINTVSKQIPNLWERFGIHYLSVNWTEKQQNIFDKKNNAVNTIFHFVEEAMELGQSCLIHSVNGKSRSCAVLIAYLIKKYAWSLNKCLEFISSKKENLAIRNNYLVQMQELEQRMMQIYNLSGEWGYSANEEDVVLRNTFANSKKPPPIPEKSQPQGQKPQKKRITWSEKPSLLSKPAQQKSMTPFKSKIPMQPLKSILKGQQNPQSQLTNDQLKEDSEQLDDIETANLRNQGNLINNINGNIVHVTVNNFITSDKKPDLQSKSVTNTRPFSSDQKDREKKVINQRKILPDYSNPTFSSKSPYESRPGTAIRAGSQNKPVLKGQEKDPKIPMLPYERPQSAKNRSVGLPSRNTKDQLIITNGLSNIYNLNKKKYPTNSRQDFFKRK